MVQWTFMLFKVHYTSNTYASYFILIVWILISSYLFNFFRAFYYSWYNLYYSSFDLIIKASNSSLINGNNFFSSQIYSIKYCIAERFISYIKQHDKTMNYNIFHCCYYLKQGTIYEIIGNISLNNIFNSFHSNILIFYL